MDKTPRILASRYEVGELIGRGGMAEVHIGHDTRLGRTVAIKVLRSDLARDPSFLARFRREAQSAAALNHPAIVAVYDTGEDIHEDASGNTVHIPFIVMEYVEGHTVRDILRDGAAVPIEEAIEITAGVLSALEYSHHAGIIHRDIKPANVMITPTGAVKVMDFGIARAVADSAATMTQTQAVIGTAQYLSPEQARGEQVDARSDLYSTGCLLFELLTGRPPFVGDSPVAVAYQHVGQNPVPPSSVASDVPEVLDRITLKALAKDRELRYATAAEFRADLDACLTGGQVHAVIPPTHVPADPNATQVLTGAAVAGAGLAAGVGAGVAAGATGLAATQALAHTPPADAIHAFGPLGGELTSTPAQGIASVDSPADTQNRRKQTLIWASIICGVLAIAAVLIGLMLSGGEGEEPPPATVAVPNIPAGSSVDQARALIEAEGLVFEERVDADSLEPEGQFVRQDPAAGTEVDPESTVFAYFSAGPEAVAVPDLEGLSQDAARSALQAVGLEPGSVSTETSTTVTRDSVTRTSPAAGESVNRGTSISIFVSNGQVEVPDLVGLPLDEAQSVIEELNLNSRIMEEESDEPVNTVLSMSPQYAPNAQIPQGATITVVVAIERAPEQVAVPHIVGQNWNTVQEQITSLGFVVSTHMAQSETLPAGYVISTDPPAGTQLDQGSTIEVTISTGAPAPTPAPSPTPAQPDPSPTPVEPNPTPTEPAGDNPGDPGEYGPGGD